MPLLQLYVVVRRAQLIAALVVALLSAPHYFTLDAFLAVRQPGLGKSAIWSARGGRADWGANDKQHFATDDARRHEQAATARFVRLVG